MNRRNPDDQRPDWMQELEGPQNEPWPTLDDEDECARDENYREHAHEASMVDRERRAA